MTLEEKIQEEREEALKEGIEQGRKEERIEFAKSLLRDNMDVQLISKLTKLSVAEIEALQKELEESE